MASAVSLGGPDSVVVYRQKEPFRRQAQLDAAANIVGRRRRSDDAAVAAASTLSLTFAVSNTSRGVLVCSRSSDTAFTVLYVRVVHCLRSQLSHCRVWNPSIESYRRQLCLSRQPLRYTALGTGCTPSLQCLGRLCLPPSVGR